MLLKFDTSFDNGAIASEKLIVPHDQQFCGDVLKSSCLIFPYVNNNLNFPSNYTFHATIHHAIAINGTQ